MSISNDLADAAGIVRAHGYKALSDRLLALAEQPAQPAQPAREWVGLTAEDRVELWKKNSSIDSFVNATEAKLKEKNT